MIPWLKGGNIPSLDGLRGIAILLVCVCHLPATTGMSFSDHWRTVVTYGDLGVDVFFVISAFLITHLLLVEQQKQGRISLPRFYVRRILRIVPAYSLLLVVGGLLVLADLLHMDETAWVAALTFNVDLLPNPAKYFVGHLWSLGVEQKFYLLWPPALLIAGRGRAIYVLLGCVVVAPVVRFIGWEYFQDQFNCNLAFFARMDTLAVGCLLAYFVRTPQATRLAANTHRHATLLVLALAAVVVVSEVLSISGKYVLGPKRFVEAGAFAGILFLTTVHAQSLVGRLLNWPPLVMVGVLSYSLYLAQAMLFLRADVPWWGSILAALAYALVSYYGVERPFLRRKAALPRKTEAARPTLQASATE
jgi:peptidoglycan/LPS O-acetylase OafA/YrhL